MLFHYRLFQGAQGFFAGSTQRQQPVLRRVCFSLGLAIGLQAPGCNAAHNLGTSVLVYVDFTLLDVI